MEIHQPIMEVEGLTKTYPGGIEAVHRHRRNGVCFSGPYQCRVGHVMAAWRGACGR